MQKSAFQKSICFCIACTVTLAVFVSGVRLGTPVKAAAYSGSGTKAAPYLVQTAEQLKNMRENLSAHYKLANTIDASSLGAFTPIGSEKSPFTGSFTCDKKADGTPLYAIKNLKVYNDSGERFGHKLYNADSYSDAANKRWEAGLFGVAKGASFDGIALLDASITNTVVGQNEMNPDWSINPKWLDQGSGALVGIAQDCTIANCSSSGTVQTKSNNTGGLVGWLVGGSVSNCYSTATVSSSAFWYTGGLIGLCDGDVNSSFATGDVSGSPTEATTGGFIGCMTEGTTAMVTSCYSTGDVLTNGFCFIGFRMDYKNYAPSWATNCYVSGSVKEYSAFSNENAQFPAQKLFALSGLKGRQDGFTTASMAEIKAGLSASADWDCTGDRPALKNVHIIKDAGSYVPGAVADVPQNNNPAPGSTSVPDNTASEADAPAEVDSTALIERMKALPDEDHISLDDLPEIKDIKAQYDALNEETTLDLPVEAIENYQMALNKIVLLVMADIVKQVNALPDVKKLTAADYDVVMAIYENYQFIGEENQEMMDEDIKDRLLASVEAVKKLQEGGGTAAAADVTTPVEWVLIAFICVFILFVLGLNIFWSYSVVKKIKAVKQVQATGVSTMEGESDAI